MKDNLVSIKSYSNEIDAQIFQGKLKAFGIKSFIFKDDCGGTDPIMQIAFGVQLKVHKRDASKALRIVDEDSRKHKNSKTKIKDNTTVYLSLLSYLMNSIGIGLLVVGYDNYRQLIFYSFIFFAFGLIFWGITKYRKAKFSDTT